MRTVFSYWGHCSVRVPNFLSSVAFDSRRVSLRPQSNQLSTLKALKEAPFLIMQSSASVMLYSPWVLMPLLILVSRHWNKRSDSLILYTPTSAILDLGIWGFSTTC